MEKEQIFIKDEADEFAAVTPGEPFRLFKWGNIYKGGKKRTVSKDKMFKLPHFKPPIKLGSHREETPAGGFLTGLEVRDDGVWAVPEFNEEGIRALEQGAYRYHSPEIIWDGGYIEDPDTGDKIQGPLIVGVALTHTPHLGESTALYTYQENNDMSEQLDTVAVPKDFWESVKDFFTFKKEEEPKPEPVEVPEEYTLAVQERDEYKARIEQMEAEKAEQDLLSAIRSEFNTEEYGAAFSQMADEAVEKLAKLDEETRSWIIEKFKALSAQVAEEEALTKEIGEDVQVQTDFNAAVEAYAAEHNMPYQTAVKVVAKEMPELFAAYKGGK